MLPAIENRLELRNRPQENCVLLQNWRDLGFIHWEYPVEVIQKLLPKGLYVDTFDNKAYIGAIPLFMRDVRPAFLKVFSGSNFCELNLRTYVYDEKGTPGIWFFSLDADHWFTVYAAAYTYLLPYHYANFTISRQNQSIHYTCQRKNQTSSTFAYAPATPIGQAKPGTLEFFLVERYLLFTELQGKLFQAQVHHKPYELYEAMVTKWDENVLAWDNLPQTKRPPDHLLFSKGVDVETFILRRC